MTLHPSPTAVRSEAAPRVVLRSRWLGVVRTAWAVLVVLTLGVCIGGVPAIYERLGTVCAGANCTQWRLSPEGASALRGAGVSADLYATVGIVLWAFSALVFLAVAALLFWRKSNEWMVLLLSFFLVLNGPGGNFLSELNQTQPAWSLPVTFLAYSSTALFVPLFYLFPDGRFVPHWTWVPALVWVVLQFSYHFFPALTRGLSNGFPWLSGTIFIGYLLSIVFAQAYRYRRVSGPVERQQTKWVVFGLAMVILGALPLALVAEGFLLPIPYQEFAGILVDPFFILIPLSIGIAILRYGLYDVDLVINRTLVYGALTACVVSIYVLVVGYLGALFRTGGNLAISLVATGLVAVLFAPLRDRLQRTVNRLMYGERNDPYAVLSRLGERLKATEAPEAVLPAIVETVAGALKLPHAAIALKRGDEFETVAASGHPKGEPLVLPLAYGTETIGKLTLSPRAPDEPFGPADRRLLDDLARHAEAAAYAVRLTADLQRSRERLVNAREEERRRLRRDLHDGLGPQLATLTLKLDAARNLLRTEPRAADALLAGLKAETKAAISDIRRLVYDLRPPALDELGLIPAIREQATNYGQNGLDVSVEAPEQPPPLPAAVEVAAYRITQEALINVVRHAKARTCRVRLSIDNELRLEITDDGTGLPENRNAGVGLSSMRERAAELSGTFVAESVPEGGTRVLARLPLQSSGVGRQLPGKSEDPKAGA